MSYPFASFGTFLFTPDERSIEETDTHWGLSPARDTSRPLGSATDSIVTTAIGSSRRNYQAYLSPSRFASLQALMDTVADFTDWERPTPDHRNALLLSVSEVERVDVICSDGVTRRRIRAQISLVSQ